MCYEDTGSEIRILNSSSQSADKNCKLSAKKCVLGNEDKNEAGIANTIFSFK